MKSFKILAASFLAVSALVANVSAATVYITGSSAFRTAAIAAINTATGLSAPTASNAALGTAGNTSFFWNGSSVKVNATFTGSAGGIQTVAGNLPVRFLKETATGTGNPNLYDPATPASAYDSVNPDIAFSDVYQDTTPFNADAGFADMSSNDFIVAIATFKWVGSKNFPTGQSVTPQFIKQLFQTGKAPLALLTGASVDRTKVIFATGRDFDSGTRLTAFAESGYGVSKTVKQYKPTISGGTVTSHVLYPVVNINGISTGSNGNGGEATGASLRGNLTATLPNSGLTDEIAGTTAAYYLSYLGTGDAFSVASNTAELKYNGTSFSVAGVQDGSYTFWSYEHLYYRDDVNADALALATTLVSTIQGYATGGTQLGAEPNLVGIANDTNVKVKRLGDGALVAPKYNF